MMSEQAEFAALLFGSAPDVPGDTSAAMFEHTFSDTSWTDDPSDHTADLIPDDFDSLADDDPGTGDSDTAGDDSWADPGTGPDADLGSSHGLDHDVLGDQYESDQYGSHHHDTTDDAGFDSGHGSGDHTGGDDGWSGDLL